MRISTSQFALQGLNLILERQQQAAHLQNQIATGKRILSPADDPAGAARVLDINTRIQQTTQFQTNADVATLRLEQEESTLVGIGNTLQRLRELNLQGMSGQYGDAERAFIAAEVRERLAELVELGNTSDSNGEYLFAGFKTTTVPITVNTAGQIVYNGDQGQRLLRIAPNREIADRDSGSDVFMAIRNGNGVFQTNANVANTGTGVISVGSVVDAASYQPDDFRVVFTGPATFDVVNDTTATVVLSAQPCVSGSLIAFNGVEVGVEGQPVAGDEFTMTPSTNQSMFATVERFASALEMMLTSPVLEANFAQDINRSLADIDQALEKVLEVSTTVGSRLNAIDSQKLVNDDFQLQLADVRSKIEDLDIVGAVVKLNLELNTLQAAQQAMVRVQGLSLFNFL